MSGIFVESASRPELGRCCQVMREGALGLRVALLVSKVTSDLQKEETTMASSVSINRRPRRRSPQPRRAEQRPVLQLPLEPPQWREPKPREQIEQDTDRGVAVVDFFI